MLIKRYAQWGKPGERNYRPPGAVSNYLFERKPGDMVEFKHIKFNIKIPYSVAEHRFPKADKITMIAVGVGIGESEVRSTRYPPFISNVAHSPHRHGF